MKQTLLSILLVAACARGVAAWPAEATTAIGRDARRLLPRTLARLLAQREPEIQREIERFPPALSRALSQDLAAGALRGETLVALDAEVGRVVALFQERRVSEGLVALGALLRVSADLSDPVLAGAAEGWPPAVSREYYALFAANMDRMPVVLDDPAALALTRERLPELWRRLAERSRAHAPRIPGELLRDGRVVSHASLDFRSPAWAVASLAYSRAVTGTAATWLAVWKSAHGDTTQTGKPRLVTPRPLDRPVVRDAQQRQPEAP